VVCPVCQQIVHKAHVLSGVQLQDMVCRECIGTLLQGRTGAGAHLICPLCRAKVLGQELVKGVNEGAQALEEEDSFTETLEKKASTSESKLVALLEEVMLCLSVYLHVCLWLHVPVTQSALFSTQSELCKLIAATAGCRLVRLLSYVI